MRRTGNFPAGGLRRPPGLFHDVTHGTAKTAFEHIADRPPNLPVKTCRLNDVSRPKVIGVTAAPRIFSAT
jgi:hypothetical protein